MTLAVAAGGGITDHGALDGLADDDHPQYLLATGTRQATKLGIGGAVPTAGLLAVPVAAPSSVNVGLISIGHGGFDGVAPGHFAGAATGTLLAGNVPAQFAFDGGALIDLQLDGFSVFRVDGDGTIRGSTNPDIGLFTALVGPSNTHLYLQQNSNLDLQFNSLTLHGTNVDVKFQNVGGKLGFFSASTVVKQARGATLANNVTPGGTDDQIDDFTNLTTYATDAAAIRNDIYQLARALRQHDVALRAYGLLT
jgi:hypothetical protein